MSDRARLVGTVELAIPIERTPMMMMTGSELAPDPAAARANLGIEVGWRYERYSPSAPVEAFSLHSIGDSTSACWSNHVLS